MTKVIKLLFLFGFLIPVSLMAQQNEIVGVVTDDLGDPAIGVVVKEKNTTNATVTDIDGKYNLKVADPSTAILVFTMLGMTEVEEKVSSRSVINVKLTTSSVMLNEIVAVGYTTMKRKDLTGSVATADIADMAKVPAANIGEALAGRIAGVFTNQGQGAPGSPVEIRVRGGMSITGNNNPLYIIDGFPTEDGLEALDPGSIESIDVLKDASATAIYGARGANGVVLITTKGGKSDTKFTVNYEGYVGARTLAKKLQVLSPYEYAYLDYERRNLLLPEEITKFESNYGPFSNISSEYKNRQGIDWQDKAFGHTALTTNHRISISGGEKQTSYSLSYSYLDDQGQMIESGQKKHNMRIKLDHKLNERLNITASAAYNIDKVYGTGTSDGTTTFTIMNHILQYRPTMGIRGKDEDLINMDVDPIFVDDSGNVMQNPVTSAENEIKEKNQKALYLNAGFTYKILKGLSFKNSTGYSNRSRRDDIFYGARSIQGKRSSINGSIRQEESATFQTANTLNFEQKKGLHSYNIMLGQEYVETQLKWFEASSYNFPSDDIGLGDLSLGATPGIPRSYVNNDNKLLSFFSRAYYNFADKYMLTASIRADGSSKFSKEHKWGYFPSASFAWRASEETFIKNLNIFSDLKIRAGYGNAGNNRIDNYGSLAIMGSVTYPINDRTQTGYASKQIPNDKLQWEANQTLNMGFDIGLFNQRLTISPEFYRNTSSKLLLRTELPSSSGYASAVQNIGKTRNTGFDITISSVNITNKDFSWRTSLNISHNKNKIIALSGEQSFLVESGFGFNQNDFLVKVGDPIGQIYGYKTTGLYQVDDFNYDETTKTYTLKPGIPYDTRKKPQPGYWKYENTDDSKTDAAGNQLITDEDRQVIGNATPDLYGGISNIFNYKNIDLSIFLNFSLGNDVLNATKMYNSQSGMPNKNALSFVDMANRWVTVNQTGERITDPNELRELNKNKTIAQYANMTATDTYIHSWGVEDGSFLRINNITLGYTFPKKLYSRLGISKFRAYVTANNIYTFTKYKGFDPEVSTRNSTGLTPGVDWGAYPRSRTFLFGVNLSF